MNDDDDDDDTLRWASDEERLAACRAFAKHDTNPEGVVGFLVRKIEELESALEAAREW